MNGITQPHAPKISSLALPFGAGRLVLARSLNSIGLTYDRNGSAITPAGLPFGTHLMAVHKDRNGRIKEIRDLGSGLVTNVGTLAMSNDFAWASPATAINVLKLANQHSSGTGATAAAVTDIKLQTPITGVASPVVAGAQSLIVPAALGTSAQQLSTVATIVYNAGGPYAVTEWGLFTDAVLTSTSGSPFTATSATSGTVTGTPLTASSTTVQGRQLFIAEAGTTTVWGLITGNTTSVITIPKWYTTAGGAAGSTPGATETYTLRPVMWDHKVFAAINVSNGDSIQFTYTLTIASGG